MQDNTPTHEEKTSPSAHANQSAPPFHPHPSPPIPPPIQDKLATQLNLAALQVVGVIALFFAPAPILMKQGYLVTTGVVTAYTFTFIPEWTTWVMLVAMALYDLCAVLTPHGPLKVNPPHPPPKPTHPSASLPLLLISSIHYRDQDYIQTQHVSLSNAVDTHTSPDTPHNMQAQLGHDHIGVYVRDWWFLIMFAVRIGWPDGQWHICGNSALCYLSVTQG